MASISKDPGGLRRILFVAPDGSRKTIRLGKVSQRSAETVKIHIEALAVAVANGSAIPDATAAWLEGRDSKLLEKLERVGLIPKKDRATVGRMLTAFVAAHPNMKPATFVVWGQNAKGIRDCFGEDRALRSISRADAEGFRQYLLDAKLSDTTIHKRLQFTRQFFAYAVRMEWISKNPFYDVSHKSGDPRGRQSYITEAETEKLIAASPNWIWRSIIAMARYGGLRCPSEVLSLRIADLDFDAGSIRVISPKTEGHGQGSRVVPMFPRLRPYLADAFDMAAVGQVNVIPETLYLPASKGPRGWVNCNLRTTFEKIVRRAGLTPWPRLFHNLRASCESDLAREYPITSVCKWIGNTVSIAARHYVQVTDEDFRRASGACKMESQQAAQKAAQSARGMACNGREQETQNAGFPGVYAVLHTCTNHQVEAAGIEPASRDISMWASTCVVG